MQTILVAGGAGYIGSHMVRLLLEAGYRPVVADIEKARRELGWTPRRGLEDILADAWAWHSSHPHGYQD